jgi:hypothetical protein
MCSGGRHGRDKMLLERPHRSKSLISVNDHFGINQPMMDRLGNIRVHR